MVARIATQNPFVRYKILTLILLRARSQWIYARWIHERCLSHWLREPRPLHHRLLPIYFPPVRARALHRLRRAHALAIVGVLLPDVYMLLPGVYIYVHQARLVPGNREARLPSSGHSGIAIAGRGRKFRWPRGRSYASQALLP